MIIRKANKPDKNQICKLMQRFNSYREKIFYPKNKEFHEKINNNTDLEDKDWPNCSLSKRTAIKKHFHF